MTIGIEKIDFYVPERYVDMRELAGVRGVDPDKFTIGIGQDKMAVTLPSEDLITLGARAAAKILTSDDRESVKLLIVGTESSTDESKAAAVVLHDLLKIQPFCRSIEMKEACYGGTAGVLFARDYVAAHPDAKALVIATDIARYGLDSAGEPTQGAGAVAMLISSDAKVAAINDDARALTADIYDFWRPTGEAFPRVDGKLSNETYIESFRQLTENVDLTQFAALAFHTPYSKMGKKALSAVTDDTRLLARLDESVQYSRQVGNCYTASLWLSLISLLENSQALSAGDNLGMFSYGSGMMAEFFSLTLSEGFRQTRHDLSARVKLTVAEYESIFTADSLDVNPEPYAIHKIENGIKYYNPA